MDVRVPRVFFKGSLVTQLMIPPRQPKRMEEWGERGKEGLGRHSSSCNFRICVHICVLSSEKEPPPTPSHTTPLPLSVCSRTLKKTNKKTPQ